MVAVLKAKKLLSKIAREAKHEGGKTIRLVGAKKKPTKEDLDTQLESYFLKNGKNEIVKSHLDADLEAFMKKQMIGGTSILSTTNQDSMLLNNFSIGTNDFSAFQN